MDTEADKVKASHRLTLFCIDRTAIKIESSCLLSLCPPALLSSGPNRGNKYFVEHWYFSSAKAVGWIFLDVGSPLYSRSWPV